MTIFEIGTGLTVFTTLTGGLFKVLKSITNIKMDIILIKNDIQWIKKELNSESEV